MFKMGSKAFANMVSKVIVIEVETVMVEDSQILILLRSDLQELIFPFSFQNLHSNLTLAAYLVATCSLF